MSEVETTEAAAPAESLDLQGAAALFVQHEEKPEQPTEAQPAEPEQAVAEEAPQESETTEDTAQAGEPAREAEPEKPEAYELDKIHGNTKIRLRDGTEWTAAELKSRIADLQEVNKSRETFQQEIQKFQTERSQIQQQAQLFAQLAPQAIAAIQATLPQVPPLPDAALAQTDPFAYSEKLAAHMSAKDVRDQKIAQMQQIQQASYQQQMRANQENAERLAQAVQEQRQKLIEKNPEFADPAKSREFQSKFMKYGREYGFSDKELSQVQNAGVIQVMKDAIAWRELQAAPKPKPNQPKPSAPNTPPVQQAGRRATGDEVQVQKRQELFQKASQNRNDLRAMADIWAQLDK